jgi:hypothetical protein
LFSDKIFSQNPIIFLIQKLDIHRSNICNPLTTMDGLGFASSVVGVISVAISIQKALFNPSLLLIKRHPDFVKNDLPTLIAFLHDIKNSFLNSREAPPAAAEASMLSCKFYSDQLNRELHKWYGPDLDRKLTVSRRVRIQLGQDTMENAYRSFRHSVLLLKDVCLLYESFVDIPQ